MATTVSEDSSAVIDERRAHQLMERAMNLAERNELASAVLACRQAIALSPQTGQSYSMLGLLLERAGDTMGAISAYEKVLEFAPDSFLERESLGRLRGAASQRQNARDMFAFDDNELFGEESLESLPTAQSNAAGSTPAAEPAFNSAAPSAPIVPQTASEAIAAPREKTDNADANNVSATLATSPAGAGSTPSTSPSSLASASAPIQPAAATAANRSSSMPFPSTQSPRPPQSGLGVPLDLPISALRLSKQSAWQRLKQRPTPYFRGVPLAGAAAASLVFLLWASNYASSNRAVETTPAAPMIAEDPFNNQNPQPAPARPSSNPTLTNQPSTSGAASTNPSSAVPTNPGAPVASGVPTNPGTPAASGVPTNPAAPSDAAPTATGSTPTTTGSASAAPSTAPAPGVAPSENGGASPSGTPVSPAGVPNKDYVRVTPAGETPVARPENSATIDERNARSNAQAGRSNAAVDSLSRAIESGGPDVALRYQQRAQLYLQNNDGARASSDFQAAISAYNDMISRGDRVAIAKSGIAACRRGLQMAQARR